MNENIFNGIADIYDKYRPSYPHALFTYLCSEAGMNASTVVADIGSGTGILSKELLDICNLVYAVEPNNDMRKIAELNLSYRDNCIFRKNRALAPHERSAVPLGTDHCPVG